MNKRNRLHIGKSQRFRILSRDGFQCRYCGAKAGFWTELEIDHVMPVSKGGTNHGENLITACERCNRGKGAKIVSAKKPHVVADDYRRDLIAQQLEAAQTAVAARENDELNQMVVNYWCDRRGTKSVHAPTIKVVIAYVKEFGARVVFPWINLAVQRFPYYYDDTRLGKYISGIRRIELNKNDW